MVKKRMLPAALALAALAAACTNAPKATPAQGAKAHATHRVESRYGFDDTVKRLQDAVQARGMTVFAVIDHQGAAQKAGLTMQPAKVIVFGTPKAGTPLMVKDPGFALQLPLRVLVTEVSGKTHVVFNDTRALIAGSKIEYAEVENTLAGAEKLIRTVVSE